MSDRDSEGSLFFNEPSPRAGAEEPTNFRWRRSDHSGDDIDGLINSAESSIEEEVEATPRRPSRRTTTPITAPSTRSVARPGSTPPPPSNTESSSPFGDDDFEHHEEEILKNIGVKEAKYMRKSSLTDDFNAVPELKQTPSQYAPVETKIVKRAGRNDIKRSLALRILVRAVPIIGIALLSFSLIMGVLYVVYKATST